MIKIQIQARMTNRKPCSSN